MYALNDIIKTRKPHVCGCNSWRVLRIGADIKLECCECKRVILLASYELDKRIKK